MVKNPFHLGQGAQESRRISLPVIRSVFSADLAALTCALSNFLMAATTLENQTAIPFFSQSRSGRGSGPVAATKLRRRSQRLCCLPAFCGLRQRALRVGGKALGLPIGHRSACLRRNIRPGLRHGGRNHGAGGGGGGGGGLGMGRFDGSVILSILLRPLSP